MISAEQNELMTRIGPATPAGKLLRNYWQPVALTVEFAKNNRAVKAVRIFSEDLVLYKTESGYGLMQRNCPHRGADLAFGRLEPDGLRCSFHGWKFDHAGK
jgi:phenylpropionate dioxygenase-like ring-hydroxylating dioxygenase large terminal subunit